MTRSQITRALFLVVLVAAVPLTVFVAMRQQVFRQHASGPVSATDWAQVGKDPQHTSFSPETLGTNFTVKWTYPFQPERVNPQIQAIVYSGMVFVGTENGNLYALDAVNPDPVHPSKGKVLWKYPIGSPIVSSVAADNGKVYVGALDGALYIINTDDGTLFRKVQLTNRFGLSASPIIANGKVFIGGRDGYFYSVDAATGNFLGKYNVGAPILQTAAWNNGKVYFGSMDMYMYALNTSDMSLAWKSPQLFGMDFKDYWPVVTGGKVLVRPQARNNWREYYSFPKVDYPFQTIWSSTDPAWNWVATNNAALIAGNDTTIPEFMNAQTTALNAYKANPNAYRKNLYILDESTGQESVVAPHWAVQTMNGTTAPGCVDRDQNIIEPVWFIRSAWGRLKLNYPVSTGVTEPRMVDILYDGLDWNGNPVTTTHNGPRGMGNPDENMALSCSQNLVIATHFSDGGIAAHYPGYFDLNNRTWHPLTKGTTSNQMQTNTGSPGANPAAISNGNVYSISFHELIMRTTN